MTLLVTPGVSAHARVVRSDPAAGASYTDAPAIITLWFNEAVETRYSSVEVLRSNGSRVMAGDLEAFNDGQPGLRLPLKETLGRDSYTIVWSVLSTVDGHVSGGFQSFTVGDAIMPSAAQQAEIARNASTEQTVPKSVDATVRWLNLLAQAVVFGALFFVFAVLLPVMRRSGVHVAAQRFRVLILGSIALLLIAQFASALIQTMNATRSVHLGALGAPLVSLLTDTRFGTLWLLRAAFLIVLTVLVRYTFRGRRVQWDGGAARLLLFASLVISALALFTSSLGSHAAVRGGRLAWPVIVDWVHFVSTSVWAGGLVAMVISLGVLPSHEVRRSVLARFSGVAAGAVLLLVLTGILSARQEVVNWDGLVSTRYGTWFLVKLILVVLTLAFGAYHLLTVRPAMALGDATAVTKPDARFRWTVRIEAVLVIAVLLATGVLTANRPARDVLEQSPDIFAATRLTAGASITLRISPGRVGNNQFSVVVAPSEGSNFGEVQRVYLRFTLREGDADAPVGESQRVQLKQSGPDNPDEYLASGPYIPLDGQWDVTIVVRRAGMLDLEVPFALTAQGSAVQLRGVMDTAAGRDNASGMILGALWAVIGASLALGGWRMRGYRQAASNALLVSSVISIVMASILLVALGGLAG